MIVAGAICVLLALCVAIIGYYEKNAWTRWHTGWVLLGFIPGINYAVGAWSLWIILYMLWRKVR